MIFSALWIFLVDVLSESINRPVSNNWNPIVRLFWFGSYKQLQKNSHSDWWSSVCVTLFLWTITERITRTKILSKFQIFSKLPAVKGCACLSELPGTEFKGSVVLINGVAWSAIYETRWRIVFILIVIFSFLVE